MVKKIGIKQLANLFDVTEQTIRFYDSKGVFPYLKREENNYRYANFEDLEWFKMVFILRNAGMELNNIKIYLDLCIEGDKTAPERLKIIVTQKEALKEKIQKLNDELDLLNNKEKHYENLIKTGEMDKWNPINFEVELKNKKII
ncbi:MerR family transcriptional regulator [Spiroplasma diminutum]|uniref:MerR family transcriptional regulator n=1 Tax=Spiroplasma diminutum CUAS-1 TaxID=1276221 RepID=S5MEG9_9MOLU|nr:MerR family transcriptional regulator [Spiroplasma diminutum]AGR42148.1 MerR family transcriptional regulator [Spiroplasma diminutum CUAS-1]